MTINPNHFPTLEFCKKLKQLIKDIGCEVFGHNIEIFPHYSNIGLKTKWLHHCDKCGRTIKVSYKKEHI